jgi:hypothetical protein
MSDSKHAEADKESGNGAGEDYQRVIKGIRVGNASLSHAGATRRLPCHSQ